MLGRSVSEYIFIRASILSLRLIAPLSIVYTLASWYSGRLLHYPWLSAYAITEALFYTCVYQPRRRMLQKVSRESRISPRFHCFSCLFEKEFRHFVSSSFA